MRLFEINPIFESGKALSDVGTRRIKREDIDATIDHISKVMSIPKEDLHALGSVGKIASSGDIDLAVDSNKFNPEHIQALMDNKGVVGMYDAKSHIASYAIPIRGDEKNGLVQVDLTFTPNPEWAKFSYFSPGEGSRFKGVVRTILLTAVASILNEPGTDHVDYDNGELVVRVGRSIDLPTGLKRQFQYRPKRISGDGYVNAMKTIEPDDFKKMYPDVELRGGKMVIDDPQRVVKALFGSSVTPKDVESAEQIIHHIKKKFTRQDQEHIFKTAARKLRAEKGKIRLPQEIEQFM